MSVLANRWCDIMNHKSELDRPFHFSYGALAFHPWSYCCHWLLMRATIVIQVCRHHLVNFTLLMWTRPRSPYNGNSPNQTVVLPSLVRTTCRLVICDNDNEQIRDTMRLLFDCLTKSSSAPLICRIQVDPRDFLRLSRKYTVNEDAYRNKKSIGPTYFVRDRWLYDLYVYDVSEVTVLQWIIILTPMSPTSRLHSRAPSRLQ